MKILLAGNPNVGKSIIFSRLTGVRVIVSNYPGTTVSYSKGFLHLYDKTVEVLDIPGIYTLQYSSKDEEVAVQMLEDTGEQDIIINIIDATNLERNLNLSLQLIEKGYPVIIALNMWDECRHKGIKIDVEKLEKLISVPVVPTVGLSGEGIYKLVNRLKEVKRKPVVKRSSDERWKIIGNIISQTQELVHRHHTFLETLEDLSLQPITGIPIAICVMTIVFLAVRFIGEGLINSIFDPFFYSLYSPLIMKLSSVLQQNSFIHEILIGKLIDGTIDFKESLGLLTTGLYVPLAMILPYIFSFYLILGLLEDFGYLPRLAVLLDNFMHRIGMHGQAFIPMILGLGCAVPGMLATRQLKTIRERFIALTLLAVSVPCAAQTAIILGLVGSYGNKYLAIVFCTLFFIWGILGFILNKIMKGLCPELLLEIPPYRIPALKLVFKKLFLRITLFLKEAIPLLLLGVLLMNILYTTGVITWLARLMQPVLTKFMGLPADVISAIIIGFLRKDIAVAMLAPLGLTAKQITIASTILTIYFPCIAAFVIMFKELGIKRLLISIAIMISIAFITGTIMNIVM